MAKEVFACGGIGKHIGGCECGSAQGGRARDSRRRIPGPRQGMLLGGLVAGRQIEETSWLSEDKGIMRGMADKGWVRRTSGDNYEITDEGRKAYEKWLDD